MKKNRLLLVTDGFPYDPGEKPFVYNEICALSASFDIDIVAYVRKQFADNEPCIELPENVKVLKYINQDIGRKEKLAFLPKIVGCSCWWNELTDIAGKNNAIKQISNSYEYLTRTLIFKKWLDQNTDIAAYDVCYTYWNTYSTLALAIDKKSHTGMKLVTRTHGYDLYDERTPYGHQCFKRFVDSMLDKVVFIAQSGHEYYMNHWGNAKTQDKYVVNHIGVKKGNSIPDKKDNEYKTLVSCSSVIPLKRVELIAEALGLIDDIDIKWIHFGSGSQFDSVSECCRQKLDGKNNIRYELKGFVDNEAVRRFYDENYVDGFITTSSTEGSPVSIQEALAYGIPVIGTDVGEISSLIDGCGYLLSANPKCSEIADAIKSLFASGADRIDSLRDTAYQRWESQYDADKNAAEFVDIAKSLCE